MKKVFWLLVMGAVASAAMAMGLGRAAEADRLTLTRLDCGAVQVNRLNAFSDTEAYPGQSKRLSVGCYLIRKGDAYMLWDTGLPATLKGVTPSTTGDMSATVSQTIPEQLARLGVKPEQIAVVAISHYHFDHIGQVATFPNAKLYIGKRDWDALRANPPAAGVDPAPFARWVSGGGAVEPVSGDKDIFGDGSVTMIDLPGHTPGHHGLLVRLAKAGPVLLTGDLTHFTENYAANGVPEFNTDRAASLASLDRFKALAANLKATVIIQHEPADIAKLPAFPKAAD